MIKISKYASVVVDVKVSSVNKPFHYIIPDNLSGLQIGHRVLIPFGHRKIEGYVVHLVDEVDFDPQKMKSIIKLLDPEPVLTIEQIEVAKWMADHYGGLYSQALQYFLPSGTRYGKRRVGQKTQLLATLLNPDLIDQHLDELPPNATKQRQVLLSLKEKPQQLASELCSVVGTNHQTLKTLQNKGYLELQSTDIKRQINFEAEHKQIPELNSDQKEALAEIINQLNNHGKPVLLHGVTGSGKTEVYLQAMKYCVAKGQQVIMMVPEIALTAQTIARITQRFPDQIAILHSGLSEGERYDQWIKIFKGEVEIVIGARSAVFAPLKNIGLIILDEEHESTYKQDEGMLKYHTRSVAMERAKHHEAVVLLGSATPSLESYHLALRGNYSLVELPRRVKNLPLPKISLVDMRAEFNNGNRSMLSEELSTRLQHTLDSGDQAIIFLNRRGFSRFVLCRECGYVIECPNCQVSLTYHQVDQGLKCHYCGFRDQLPSSCPECASRYLRQFGSGTQQVDEFLKQSFPKIRTVRLDADTTRTKGAHQRLLNQFKSGKADVLVGTQMIAKGLDFPNVTLVGVLSADLSLNFPDFRASERTFQLLTQVSGRAGRDLKPGNVVIQCYDPTHYSLMAVKSHDYVRFYRQEITFRRELRYPPFGHLARILIQGPEKIVETEAKAIYRTLSQKNFGQTEIFGPGPAPIQKIKGRFRWQILLKSQEPINQFLLDIARNDQDLTVTVDCDPLFLL